MSTAKSDISTHRFLINVSSNLAMFGLNVVAGLWFTPYLVAHLGVAAYGIVILALSVARYMAVFDTALNNAVGRFLTLDVRRGAAEAANRTFNTAFWTAVCLIILLLPLLLLAVPAALRFFDIPAGMETAAYWLFVCVLLSTLLVLLRGVFSATAFARNRLDLQNGIQASNTVVRIGVVVALFGWLATATLWQVGVGILAGGAASLLLAIVVWRRLTPELRIGRGQFDQTHLQQMVGMSWWIVVNQVGALLFLNIDLLVVNRYLGAEVQGRYGTVLQWSVLLRTLASTVATALTPIILAQYAARNMDKVALTSGQAVKLMGLGMALPVGLVAGLAAPLLDVWLGPAFVDLAPLLVLLTAPLAINLAVLPLFSTQTAMNRVRWPGIVSLVTGVLNLGLALWWVNWGRGGMGVAAAGALVLTLKNALFMPLYNAHIQRLPWRTFVLRLLPGAVGLGVVGGASVAAARLVALDSWWALGTAVCLLSGGYLLLVYRIGLTAQERALLRAVIRR
ncbi:MAG: oligosaccharide flippase family protein [Anaerolineales bacterium]|nr:oligosaccharide flippase family protein [Anaerolineales bacterium]